MLSFNTEEIAQNKLLILYILKNIPEAISNNELTEFILDKGFMNYFALQQYLGELSEGELIKLNEDTMEYVLLEKGYEVLGLFDAKIPEKIIEQLDKEFQLKKTLKTIETQVIGDYFQKENKQYTVSLKLVENEETLFSLYFDIANEEMAQKYAKLWKDDTQFFYQNILELFIKHKDRVERS